MWCHWCYMMPMVASIAPLHSLHQDNRNDVQHHLFGHWHYWQGVGYVLPAVLSMVWLHSLGQENWIEVHHDLFDHLTPLVLASTLCDANRIINGTIAFLGTRASYEMQHIFILMQPNNVVYISTPHSWNIQVKKKKKKNPPNCNFYFPCYKHKCTNNYYDP